MVLGAGSVVAAVAVAGALALGAVVARHNGSEVDVRPTRAGPAGDAMRAAGPVDPGDLATGYVLPVAGEPAVVHPFDAPPSAWSAGHRGVDLGAEVGQAVRAPADGTVTFVGTVVDRGVVTLAHPDGLRSSLEPVAGVVVAGAHVAQGQLIGTLQGTAGHCAPATCLHWGVRRGEAYLDPLSLLPGAGPIVLLPEH